MSLTVTLSITVFTCLAQTTVLRAHRECAMTEPQTLGRAEQSMPLRWSEQTGAAAVLATGGMVVSLAAEDMLSAAAEDVSMAPVAGGFVVSSAVASGMVPEE